MKRYRLSPQARDAVAAYRPGLAPAAARAVFVTGTGPDLVLRAAGAAAMALGRHVLVRRALVRAGPSSHVLPARLVVHELAHVAQFAVGGAALFLAGYLAAYVRGLRGLRSVHREAAYRAIPAEVLARQAEAGLEWPEAFRVEPL
ncbi:MAG TPA: DUF4157 domain-containing protein [Vicinamibacteria bacterium]|nr:DUF4157 domain-containing protein [Vicinamibacteria bacterium]